MPKGSNLGPSLFSLFFNDVTTVVRESECLLYADNLRLFLPARCFGDCLVLQASIDSFSDWCLNNDLQISIYECSSMSFHRSNCPTAFNYCVSGTQLQRHSAVKDLGVTLDHKLDIHVHHNETIDSANKMLGFIRMQSREFYDSHCLVALYKSLVRSILEYFSVVWCSSSSSLWWNKIESVQKKFIRLVLQFTPWRNVPARPSYHARCLIFGLESLATRRETAQIMFNEENHSRRDRFIGPLARVNFHVPVRNLRSYKLLRVDQTRGAYSDNEPLTAMAIRFNAHWHMTLLTGIPCVSFCDTICYLFCGDVILYRDALCYLLLP